MIFYEKQIEEYENYKPELTKREDFENFWEETLKESAVSPLHIQMKPINYPIDQIVAYKLIYRGFAGTPINAFYILPKDKNKDLPCIIIFHGYGGNKGSISNYMKWTIQGYAVLAVDCRGHGESAEDTLYSFGSTGTWATQGILDKYEYYYRKIYVDCKRAVDVIFTRNEIDKSRICLHGASLGGGISLAVAALDNRPTLVVADVPNMCNIELAVQQKFEGSLVSIENFMNRYPEKSKQVFETLSYFDNLNLAQWIKSKTRVSVAFKDLICPPQSVYGVYNQIDAEKLIISYPFSGHDAPGIISHIDQTIAYIKENL
ncbi:acetylxylan esterase [Bacillus sinesaloumensis]|uniref:acetylxylan esterase n=1 Tax=Litchfieldia sinesaloumensis TaxID=1926280 RepID=UPI0013563CC6|nr:alpha/beta fold hydrolase [Bacillus sinesaloumensis]